MRRLVTLGLMAGALALGAACDALLEDDGTGEECGEVTEQGECAGDTLRFCNGGVLAEEDCAAIDCTCGLDTGEDFYACLC